MPLYFESEDQKFSGCTSEKRNKSGTNTLKNIDTHALNNSPGDPIHLTNSTTWCVIFSDKNKDEGHPKSCSNIRMLDKATCFPRTQTDATKTLQIHELKGEEDSRGSRTIYAPATIQCQQKGKIHTCIEDKSLLRYMLSTKGTTKDGNPIKTMADLDSQDTFYSCSNFEQMHITGNIAWDDVATNTGVAKVVSNAAGTISQSANIIEKSPNGGVALSAFTELLQKIQK
jgi:hypothetical protein